MKFSVEIKCDNAAFEAPHTNSELASILIDLAKRVDDSEPLDPTNKVDDGRTYILRDFNGNRVGQAVVSFE